MKLLEVIDRVGILEDFEKTHTLQRSLQEEKILKRENNEIYNDTIILVEHNHVYTTGRSVPFQNPIFEADEKIEKNIPWIEIGRGGKATYHGPGQLVAYPIFDLNHHEKDVHRYIRKLEQVILKLLTYFDLKGEIIEGNTGIWVRNSNDQLKKIASIGIGVKKWVSIHGISFNLKPDLRYFSSIQACENSGFDVTSIEEIFSERGIKRLPKQEEVKEWLLQSFKEVFNFDRVARGRYPRPAWLKVKAPGSPDFNQTNNIIREQKLVTVCEEAHCPNIGECWTHKTATFMIMGDLCTRRCSFCAVKDGDNENLQPLDILEPRRVAVAIKELGLKHVVITSVNRDDIEDMGAEHFNQTVKAIKFENPNCRIELLIPDMRGRKDLVDTILKSGHVSVLNHNLETVPRLYKTVRPGANFQRSLAILKHAKEENPNLLTKSGIMVGLGETKEEVFELMDHLREANVDIMTIGQYLQPTDKQLPVQDFVSPTIFKEYEKAGLEKGFPFIESGPLVRSSYHAWQHADGASEDKIGSPVEQISL